MNRKQLQIYIALLSILLFIGQMGVLTHSVKHLFHTADQSCQIFLQADKSDNGLITDGLQLPVQLSYIAAINPIISRWLSFPQSSYNARAPPLFPRK